MLKEARYWVEVGSDEGLLDSFSPLAVFVSVFLSFSLFSFDLFASFTSFPLALSPVTQLLMKFTFSCSWQCYSPSSFSVSMDYVLLAVQPLRFLCLAESTLPSTTLLLYVLLIIDSAYSRIEYNVAAEMKRYRVPCRGRDKYTLCVLRFCEFLIQKPLWDSSG